MVLLAALVAGLRAALRRGNSLGPTQAGPVMRIDALVAGLRSAKAEDLRCYALRVAEDSPTDATALRSAALALDESADLLVGQVEPAADDPRRDS